MTKIVYSILTHIPIVGGIIHAAVDLRYSSWGLADGVYNEEMALLKEYLAAHPKQQATRQLAKKLMGKRAE